MTAFSSPSPDSGLRPDAPNPPTRWSLFCSGVLIPLSSIAAAFLFMVAIMLIAD